MALASCLACGMMRAQTQGSQKTMKAYMVADAHLDTQWNWDIQTTIKDYVWKTITQNLYLLKTYPDYVFNFEGAVKYNWMKEYYPREFEEVKKYIANGRWHLTGSSWDANETVICSPESWLRNVLLGQTFYRTEFNKEGDDIFLPDCFGFGYDMPTLMNHCGLIGFSSQKLGWRDNPFYEGGKKYPYTIGLWKGIDGSQVMMTHGFDYGHRFNDEDLTNSDMLKSEIAQSPLNMVYRYYGTGDTGGSPTVASVRSIEKSLKGTGPIQIISSTSDQIYKDFLPFDKHPELPTADGEMTMDVHGTGCYTSQAAMKLYNRQNEHLGDAAERASVAAEWLGAVTYPTKEMTDNYRRFIWHQFHDDLTGTSIPRAYEFSWNDELLSLGRFSNVLTTAVSGVAARMNTKVNGMPVVLYNTEAFPTNTVVELPMLPSFDRMLSSVTVYDAQGKLVRSQLVNDSKGRKHILAEASLPGTSFSVYTLKGSSKKVAGPVVSKNGSTIENSVYKLTVNGEGNISSIVDKRSGKELVASGKSIGLVVFDDCKSYSWPSWEVLKATVDKAPVDVKDQVKTEITEAGPLRTTIHVTKTYGKSTFSQYIHLYEGAKADQIDVYNEVDWHSLNALLKANFPLNVSNEKATYDLGLGSIERGNNRPQAYEVYAHEWTDLTDSNGSYGVTILNDSKYGWDKPNDNTIRLSLLYAPKSDGGYVYQEKQDQGYHEFTYSIVGHQGALDKAKAVQQSTLLNSPVHAFTTLRHGGALGSEFSFLSSDNANVTVHALKKAEVSNEYVVRVYENSGKEMQNAHITFGGKIVKAVEADGTEKEIGAASFAGNQLSVSIKPFSVKTYKVVLDNKNMTEQAAEPLTLPYDRRCFSPNDFRASANFSSGYSYAAELLPDEGLTVDNVHFTFGQKDAANGVTCKGNKIALPKGNKYNKVYILAASARGDRQVTFAVGDSKLMVTVPEYTGFIGQWGHEGHTKGYLKDAEVAYVGTHRHSSTKDEVYEYTYMFKYGVNIPKGATELTLPNDDNVVVFAATLVNEDVQAQPAEPLFRTNNKAENADGGTAVKVNLLKGAKVVDKSGEVNNREKAENLNDGNLETKWCDTNAAPNYVAFDLGSAKTVSGWKLISAGDEDSGYITRGCLLQGRNSLTEEWKTLDMVDGNKANTVERDFTPASMRYIRVFVTGQSQEIGHDAARIYELEVY